MTCDLRHRAIRGGAWREGLTKGAALQRRWLSAVPRRSKRSRQLRRPLKGTERKQDHQIVIANCASPKAHKMVVSRISWAFLLSQNSWPGLRCPEKDEPQLLKQPGFDAG
jgi:hypothetical protein